MDKRLIARKTHAPPEHPLTRPCKGYARVQPVNATLDGVYPQDARRFVFIQMNIPTLETARLKLRAFTIDDWEPYAEMYADASFARYLGGKLLSKKEAWENIAIILGHWTLLGYGIWALESKTTGQLVGRAGLLNLPGWPDVEVCWALSPQFWGNGYATEAAKASIHWAFAEAGIGCLISLIDPENKPSEAVALRLGEKFRERITFDGKPTNVYEIVNPTSA